MCHVYTHPDADTMFLPIIPCDAYTLPELVYTSTSHIET